MMLLPLPYFSPFHILIHDNANPPTPIVQVLNDGADPKEKQMLDDDADADENYVQMLKKKIFLMI